jgi:hypothetical protein
MIFAFLTLFTSSINSCEIFYCEKCTNGSQTITECSQHSIEELEQNGWDCEAM